ncbi:MAG TPA: HupE/UreJ family protein, partial [Steroidobacteraceae bacterium]|nr:HupE/UreJ family protein [Steroidobacteraceae bacterium]
QPVRTGLLESLKVVTAFTVAHSITLTLAATGVMVLAPKPVEAAIAATVAITALSAFWRPTRLQGWPLAFAFGLVHGFGFAGAFAEMIRGETSATTLGSFNLGIEIAQVLLAIALLPLLYVLARRPAFNRHVAPAISAVVAGLAMSWFVERLA